MDSNFIQGDRERYISLFETLILVAAILSLYLPMHLSFLLIPTLYIVIKDRKTFHIGGDLKFIFILFVIYMLIFTLTSYDLQRSVKGSYDMLRGLYLFFVALALAERLKQDRNYILMSLCVTVFIFGNFYFKRGHFFGYYANPNNVSVSLVLCLSLILPFFIRTRLKIYGIVLSMTGIIAGVYLLILANSRGAWAGLAIGIVIIMMFNRGISWRIRGGSVIAVLSAWSVLMVYFNIKGFSSSARFEIWSGLLYATLEHNIVAGYGINYVKDLMSDLNLPTMTAHNILLEIFVTSGVIGLLSMAYIVYRLFRHLTSYEYNQNMLYYVGILGAIAFLIMGQFDLKFSSFKFIASMSMFIGLIYSQRTLQDKPHKMADHTI